MARRTYLSILVLVSLLGTSKVFAFSDPPSPEIDERIPTFPDYRDLNGYFQHWNLAPDWGVGLFVGFDFQKRVVNLTPAPEVSGTPELVLDDYRDGFRYTRVEGFDGALAPIGVLETAKSLSTWAPFAALMPVYGRRNIVSQYVSTREQMKKLPRLRVPETPADLEKWNLNDWLTYETTGGVMFVVGAGSSIAGGAELRFAAAGEWSMAVEKVAMNSVFVRIAKKEIKTFAQLIGTGTIVLENTLFNNQDETFAYVFDLNQPEGQNAYIEMLAGNLIPAQELATRANGAARAAESLRAEEKGRLTTLRVGFPFFFYGGRTRGNIHLAHTYTTRNDGSSTSAEFGVRLDERAVGGIFLINRRTLNDFFAASIVNRTPEGKIASESYGGQFIWAYENVKASRKRVRNELDKLIKQTGLHEELALVVPEAPLGYIIASLRVNFDQETTDELIRVGLDKLSADDHRRALSVSFVREYFAEGTDGDKLCQVYDTIERCARRLERETREALQEAAQGIKEMDDARKASDRTAFVRAFAAVGKTLFKNQFTVKSTLALLRRRPVKMHFAIAGERISLLKKNVEWKRAIP